MTIVVPMTKEAEIKDNEYYSVIQEPAVDEAAAITDRAISLPHALNCLTILELPSGINVTLKFNGTGNDSVPIIEGDKIKDMSIRTLHYSTTGGLTANTIKMYGEWRV